jgi:hypothetical protein
MCQCRRGVSQGGAQAQSEREKFPNLFREYDFAIRVYESWARIDITRARERLARGRRGEEENVSAKKVASMSQWRSCKKHYQIFPE